MVYLDCLSFRLLTIFLLPSYSVLSVILFNGTEDSISFHLFDISCYLMGEENKNKQTMPRATFRRTCQGYEHSARPL
jgi:hypothetical protein